MTLIHERVALARDGKNPTVIGRMASGWAVLGDSQLPLGYSLLLSDPVVFGLNDLASAERAQFLADMAALGDALLAVTSAYRINYEIQCNGDQALHAHVFARYEAEAPERRRCPVWMYEPLQRSATPFDPVLHAGLREAIRGWLKERGLLVPVG